MSGFKCAASRLDPTAGSGAGILPDSSYPGTSYLELYLHRATESYSNATALSHIPFNLPQRADSNEYLPDPGGHLLGELQFF